MSQRHRVWLRDEESLMSNTLSSGVCGLNERARVCVWCVCACVFLDTLWGKKYISNQQCNDISLTIHTQSNHSFFGWWDGSFQPGINELTEWKNTATNGGSCCKCSVRTKKKKTYTRMCVCEHIDRIEYRQCKETKAFAKAAAIHLSISCFSHFLGYLHFFLKSTHPIDPTPCVCVSQSVASKKESARRALVSHRAHFNR